MAKGEMLPESAVQSVDRALVILEILANSRRSLSVTEIGREVGLHKSTVYRLLSTMARRGYVEQDPETQRYKLGLKVLEVSNKLLGTLQVRTEAMPFLRELAEACGEAVHLAVLNDGEVVYVEKVEGAGAFPMYSQIGRRAPVHCTAVGKAILAHLPEEEVRAIVAARGLTPRTDKTVSDIETLFAHLVQVRSLGYAVDQEEHEAGVACVAAPVFDYRGRVIAAVSVSGTSARVVGPEGENLAVIARRVKEAGEAISRRLGYQKLV